MTVDVALKVIPKKKVKGNEDSVWGEMEVLKGLDHKNIVSRALPMPSRMFVPDVQSGEILRMVRVEIQVLSRL